MKVLQILTHLNSGGITTYVYSITKFLLKKNIEVGVVSSGGKWEEKFRSLGAKVFRVDIKTKSEISPKIILSLFKLYKIKKEFDFQIIHSHTRTTQVLSQIFSKLSGVVHIANFHGFYKQNKLRKWRRIFKASGKTAIAITPQVGEDLANIFKVKKEKVKVIVSGIDLERLDKNLPSLNLKGYPKIGSSGRLSEIKGFKYLLMSMPAILERYPQAYLYILGEGKEERKLLELSKKLKIEKNFKILKNVEVAAFLKSLDIFCLPSLEEPLGLSVIEAQYFGLPCIVSSVGGLPIIVKHLHTGLHILPKDHLKITEAVELLLENSGLKEKISKSSYKQVIEKFDFSRKIDKFIKIYEKALKP